jgi:hypothetical protein
MTSFIISADKNVIEICAVLGYYVTLSGSTVVSGQPICPILTLEDGTDRLTRNVDTELTLRNIPQERRSYLHRGGNLKSRNSIIVLMHKHCRPIERQALSRVNTITCTVFLPQFQVFKCRAQSVWDLWWRKSGIVVSFLRNDSLFP